METFKIIVIIFLILLTYQIYQINCVVFKDRVEGFADSPTQSLGGVDDANSINTLAQIARKLMDGTLTLPGNLNIQGDLVFPNQTTIKGAGRLHIGGEELLYLLNKKGVMIGKEWGGTGDLNVQGNVGVGGNSNLAGLATPLSIIKGAASPDNTKFQWGDGTGWRLRFQKDDAHPTMDIYDNGNVSIVGSLGVSGRDILAELNDLKANAVRKDQQYYIDIGVRANGDGCCGNGKGLIIHGGGDSTAAGWGDKGVTTRFNFRQV